MHQNDRAILETVAVAATARELDAVLHEKLGAQDAARATFRHALANDDLDRAMIALRRDHQHGIVIDIILAEQQRRTEQPQAVIAGEHPPELFEY